jgi:hypothetical protein
MTVIVRREDRCGVLLQQDLVTPQHGCVEVDRHRLGAAADRTAGESRPCASEATSSEFKMSNA